MFNTSLRYLSLIILPHPSFDVPLSEGEPEFQIHGRNGGHDSSYMLSQNEISHFGPLEFSTPSRPVLKANSSYEGRRNTICCYSRHLADSFPANEDIPTWPANISSNSFLSSDTSRQPFYEEMPALSTSTSVKIVTPHYSPPISSRVGQPRITSFVDLSDLSDDRVSPKKVGRKRKNARKKRSSAPPAVSLGEARFNSQDNGVIDITSTHEKQRQKPLATSISPYTSKHFEIDLSPIIEDTHTFTNILRGPKGVERTPATIDLIDSSESSYGEVIHKRTIDYLSTSEYGSFGGWEWENEEREKPPSSFARFGTQNYANPRGHPYWGDDFWETFEDSSLIPELTLTAPTPEMTTVAQFRSEIPIELLCDQPPVTNADRPSRLGYSTTLASISKALGSGTDRLLGVGNGVFDDILDTGVDSAGTLRRAVSTCAGDGRLGSLALQSKCNSQAETGFLGQLLRRKSTGRSQMSKRKDRVWKRVSLILRSSRRSRSVRDQEKSTASTPGLLDESHAANEPLNASHGWKRFSRNFANAMILPRRRSAGDHVPFSESVDPLEEAHTGSSNFGSTRRHGLDIPSDSRARIQLWHGSSSARPGNIKEKNAATHLDKPTRATRKNIVAFGNWYGNFFGTDGIKSGDQEPRRHSFGLDLGKRLSKRRWRTSAEDRPRGSWLIEEERIRDRCERHSAVY